jgi:hypothetical protein
MSTHGGFAFSRGGDGVAVAFQRATDAVAVVTNGVRVQHDRPDSRLPMRSGSTCRQSPWPT